MPSQNFYLIINEILGVGHCIVTIGKIFFMTMLVLYLTDICIINFTFQIGIILIINSYYLEEEDEYENNHQKVGVDSILHNLKEIQLCNKKSTVSHLQGHV